MHSLVRSILHAIADRRVGTSSRHRPRGAEVVRAAPSRSLRGRQAHGLVSSLLGAIHGGPDLRGRGVTMSRHRCDSANGLFTAMTATAFSLLVLIFVLILNVMKTLFRESFHSARLTGKT